MSEDICVPNTPDEKLPADELIWQTSHADMLKQSKLFRSKRPTKAQLGSARLVS